MFLYLYRVLENDQDGDPLDHGVAVAPNLNEAIRIIREHMLPILLNGSYDVRVYELAGQVDLEAGVPETTDLTNHHINLDRKRRQA